MISKLDQDFRYICSDVSKQDWGEWNISRVAIIFHQKHTFEISVEGPTWMKHLMNRETKCVWRTDDSCHGWGITCLRCWLLSPDMKFLGDFDISCFGKNPRNFDGSRKAEERFNENMMLEACDLNL